MFFVLFSIFEMYPLSLKIVFLLFSIMSPEGDSAFWGGRTPSGKTLALLFFKP